MDSQSDAKDRFSNRVADYRAYRPGYPQEAIDFIRDTCEAEPSWSLVDIGSGTGISTAALIRSFGCTVFGVEPNDHMRAEAENALGGNPLFRSVKGDAYDTTLPEASVDLVAAFQAFHWFDRPKARREWRRTLKNPPWTLLVWNDRIKTGSDFLEGYEAILRELPEYRRVNHNNLAPDDIQEFFGREQCIRTGFPNSQRFDLEGLTGRFFSASYAAARGSKAYDTQKSQLERLFEKTNTQGVVELSYSTETYLGKLT